MDRRGFMRVLGKAAFAVPALALVPSVLPPKAAPVARGQASDPGVVRTVGYSAPAWTAGTSGTTYYTARGTAVTKVYLADNRYWKRWGGRA